MVFKWFDDLKACVFGLDLNWWRHQKETRLSVLTISGLALFMWIIQGFDSGVGEYGVSMHWSVFVIYGVFYYFMSLNLEKKMVTGSKNVFISFVLTGFSLAVFEWMWMESYFYVHNMKWILYDNLGHIIPNTILTIIGLVAIFYTNTLGERDEKKSSYLWMVLLLPMAIWVSVGFPQTCYPQADETIIYIENNVVHLLNVLAKCGVTWWIYEAIKK